MSRGRPREFDKTAALEQATQMFWRNGYRGVSLDDLTEAMQIKKPSLYAAFGDKEELFLASIDHYRETVMVPIFRELMECDELASGFKKYFKAICKVVTNEETPGCLIACMLTQETFDSPAIRKKLSDTIDGADMAFRKLLKDHRDELRGSVDPESAASLITSTLHGMSIRARAGATSKDLAPIADALIKLICKSA